ncbi:hypothetical protein J6590_089532 [Homalodisca vitripennis]|nr:hypothetical protein J6590_051692 [Homalodisca vitripennis]KAG8299931.1 hypothetical protein J6590_089532 [Homalodisca vitripennis]
MEMDLLSPEGNPILYPPCIVIWAPVAEVCQSNGSWNIRLCLADRRNDASFRFTALADNGTTKRRVVPLHSASGQRTEETMRRDFAVC